MVVDSSPGLGHGSVVCGWHDARSDFRDKIHDHVEEWRGLI